MPPTPWPDYAPTNQPSARTYLEAIVALCNGWLAVLPPNPNNLYVLKYTAIRDAAWKDLENVAHGKLRQYVVETTGEPVDSDPANLQTAWGQVVACHGIVSLPQPMLLQLGSALESIDHMGGGGAGGDAAADAEPERAPWKGWLGYCPSREAIPLGALLDAVEAAAVGLLLRRGAAASALAAAAGALYAARRLRRLASDASATPPASASRAAHASVRALHAQLRRIAPDPKRLRGATAGVTKSSRWAPPR